MYREELCREMERERERGGRRRPLVYLASPLGFSSSAKEFILPRFVQALELCGCEVYEPFSQNEQAGRGPGNGTSAETWAFDIAHADRDAAAECDAIFAIINGLPPDEGVAGNSALRRVRGSPPFCSEMIFVVQVTATWTFPSI